MIAGTGLIAQAVAGALDQLEDELALAHESDDAMVYRCVVLTDVRVEGVVEEAKRVHVASFGGGGENALVEALDLVYEAIDGIADEIMRVHGHEIIEHLRSVETEVADDDQ